MKPTLDLEQLFFEVSEEYLKEKNSFSTRGEVGVFSQAAVVWLGIQQRLRDNSLSASMGALIEKVKSETSPLSLVARPGRKFRERKISANTGGISRARDRLSEQLVSELFDKATENIELRLEEDQGIYVLDGQVITISRSASILKEFGHVYTGEGEFHFPKIRVVSLHHLESGICKGVVIGSYYQSETVLAANLISRLSAGSMVIADRFYDKPTFIDTANKNKVHVVVRLKDKQARRLLGDSVNDKNTQKEVSWKPASKALQHITIKGNLFKYTAELSEFRASEFYFFSTNSDLTIQQVANLYRQRVRVEIFIRQLKQTLKMFFIRAKKADNIRKEIYIAYLTFNLLRAIMYTAAKLGNMEPERMSFTAAINLTRAYAQPFLKARSLS